MATKWKNWNGPRAILKMEKASRKAIKDILDDILTDAVQEVPLDEGTLQNSGMVRMHTTKPIGVVCFGGGIGTGLPKIPYARRWHENSANFQHGRKRFYLRDPFNRHVKNLKTKLKSGIRSEFR